MTSQDELKAYCGLDCAKCDAYIATKNDDQALREKTAALWTRLNQVEIRPEQINCEGCRANGVKTIFCEKLCKVRQCAQKRGVDLCKSCGDWASCEAVQAILSHQMK